ncbi:hypothetical protein Pint_11873 [Pistacia integerrima]|uniref:Uncharacterized protein n=1 Tax=Pistacia integerrima TaxID=434235 RepID=A0ACC0XKM1_9ROSI|nr:hypothetical protein Pint_11873 [Pistacia integerrima]
MLHPPMSRIVNMLVGEIEVETVTSKPSCLADWDCMDTTNSILNKDIVTSSSTSYSRKKSQCENAIDDSPGVDPLLSPVNVTRFSDMIAEGR